VRVKNRLEKREERERIGEKSKPTFLSFQERRETRVFREIFFVTNEKISEKSNEKKKNETQMTKSS
jgi:hypothetical protein